jgi:G:T/U-mismatch repair DNA glycosylase
VLVRSKPSSARGEEYLPTENKYTLFRWKASYFSSQDAEVETQDITENELNDFAVLKGIAPNIRLICFNGAGAAEAEKSLVHLGYRTRLLPSSSGANRRDQDGRLIRWKAAFGCTRADQKPCLPRGIYLIY